MSKSKTIALIIVVIIALGVIAYAGYQSFLSVPGTEPNLPIATESDNSSNPYADKLVSAKHQYQAQSDKHIIAGTFITPTICHRLETSVSVDRSAAPVVATLEFKLINTSEICAQAIGEARFKVGFQAPKDADIQATLNGYPIELNLIPASANEDLSDFQIYTKG